MAFRIDAGQAGAKETESATRLAVSVARLGKRDASYRYKRSTVTVRAGRSAVWVVWLNVLPPFAIRGPGDTEPRLWQDEEGRWRVSGDAENCPDLPAYERFCAAANAGKVGPEPVLVSRLWCPRQRASGKERRCPTPAPRPPPSSNSTLGQGGTAAEPRTGGGGSLEPAPASRADKNCYDLLNSWCDEVAEESGTAADEGRGLTAAYAPGGRETPRGRGITAAYAPGDRAKLATEDRALDACAASVQNERRRRKTRRKNRRRREESRRSAEEDARLRHDVHEAFARERAVELGLDPSFWPFVPLSTEAAAAMARECAEVETLIHLVERNHRLRRAQPRETPQEEPPARLGRRVCFADPLVAHDVSLSREAPGLCGQSKGAGTCDGESRKCTGVRQRSHRPALAAETGRPALAAKTGRPTLAAEIGGGSRGRLWSPKHPALDTEAGQRAPGESLPYGGRCDGPCPGPRTASRVRPGRLRIRSALDY